MKSKLIPLIALAMGASADWFRSRPQKPVYVLPRTGDGKSPIPVDPTIHDLERIEAAKAKRIARAEKRAVNIAKSKANNYR
jgi:hypothetical protein